MNFELSARVGRVPRRVLMASRTGHVLAQAEEPVGEGHQLDKPASAGIGWRGWIVLLALAIANLLIVAIFYQSFMLGE
jgi:hypothetical protein